MDGQRIASDLEEAGYTVSEGVCPSELPVVAASLGYIRVDPRSPEAIRAIRPQAVGEAKPNTLSSRHGMGSFPFHTDVAHWTEPARFLMLYCEQPGRGSRRTHLQDSLSWNIDRETKGAMLREVWKSGHARPQLCTVGAIVHDRFALRFDEACMTPMTVSASELGCRIEQHIQASPVIDIHWTAGVMLVIDNHRMLHARGKAVRPDPDRVIVRILIGDKI